MADDKFKGIKTEWVVKNTKGKLRGPFSTSKIFEMINDGSIEGTEQISKYPDGDWIQISKEPQFFDRILFTLQSELGVSDETIAPPMKPVIEEYEPSQIHIVNDEKEQETENAPEEVVNTSEQLDAEKTQITQKLSYLNDAKRESLNQKITFPTVRDPNDKDGTVVVNLEEFKKKQLVTKAIQQNTKSGSTLPPPKKKKKKKKSGVFPLFIVLIAGLFILSTLLEDDGEVEQKKSDKVALKVPGKTGQPLDVGKKQELLKRAILSIESDSYSRYVQAQDDLIALAESETQNTEVRGLLCLVHRQIWPFAEQGSEDIVALNYMSQSTRAIDPLSYNGQVCETVRLMAQGRYRESKGVVEGALNNPAFVGVGMLYQLKADLAFGEKDLNTAIAYAQKAEELWPSWSEPKEIIAKAYWDQSKLEDSIKYWGEILKLNPNHKNALYHSGAYNYIKTKNIDGALSYFKKAESLGDKLFPTDESIGLINYAQVLIEKGDMAAARVIAERAYALTPSNSITKELVLKTGGSLNLDSAKDGRYNEMVYLGDQYFRSGDLLSAQAEYKAAYELDSTNGLAAMKAAKALWLLNQSQDAIDWLNKAVKSDPKLIQAYSLLADYHSQRYSYLTAVKALNKGASVAPGSVEILRGFGLVELRRNNFSGAIGYGQRAIKVFERDVDTILLLARAYYGSKDFKEANRYAILAIENDNANVDAHIIYAKVQAEITGFDSAIAYLENQIARFPYTMDYRIAIAELNKDQERYSQAQAIYEQIVELDPKNKKAMLGLGECQQAQLLVDRALRTFLNTAVIDPTDAEPLFKAAQIYMDKNKHNEALIQLERVIKINPLYPRASYLIGKVYFQRGDFKTALAAADEEKKLNPNVADPYILTAEIYFANKQFQKCAAEYQMAVKLRPSGAELYVNMARCYRLSANLDVARAMLDVAMSKESGYPDIWKETGAIYEMQGDKSSAMSAYNKYLTLSPNAPDRADVENRINKLSSGL